MSIRPGGGGAPAPTGGSSPVKFGRLTATITSPSGTPTWTDTGGASILWHDDGAGQVVFDEAGIYDVKANGSLDASHDQALIFEIGGSYAGNNFEAFFGADHVVTDKGVSVSGTAYFPETGGTVTADLNYSSAPSLFNSATLELVIVRLGDYPA